MNEEYRQPIPAARVCLTRAESGAADEFEILAISAGEGNGWIFPAEVLRASLGLWAQVETFIDHHSTAPGGRSLRDLAGFCRDPRWDETTRGIRMRLHPVGPAADLLRELGRAMLSAPSPADVGFSADLLFTAQGKTVERILKVFSVDLVFDPARGGKFLRAVETALHTQTHPNKENDTMTEPIVTPGLAPTEPTPPAAPDTPQASLRPYLLETALQAAQLPAAAAERLRQQFSGTDFTPQDLRQAIDDSRAFVAELTAAQGVQGPGRFHSQFTSEDRLQAAVDDLFGLPREAHLQNVRPARLSGIRELYFALTGDEDLHGGIYPERVRLATTSDFSGLVKNAMNKIVVNTWDALGRV